MRVIKIENDIYDYLLKNTVEFGESESSVLRRLLGLSAAESTGIEKSELLKLTASSEFLYAKGVVGKFLVILKWLHDRAGEKFSLVESVKGRGRLYFAKDPAILEASGNNVNPKQIPNTGYWVITTTPTDLKQEILEKVMKALGHEPTDVRIAVDAIAR
jgi:negative modulator of initiation of replication